MQTNRKRKETCPLRSYSTAVLFLLFVLCSIKSNAQVKDKYISDEAVLKGKVKDSTHDKLYLLCVIALLQPDSSLVRFIRTGKDGDFLLDHIAPGRYILLITHPYYSEFSLTLTLNEGKTVNLGYIFLLPHASLLEPVVVTPSFTGPRMKGDTLEYNTGGIRLRANSTIEELLNRLPGIQIDADGYFTVNGQRIERLLVDGKEFFGHDLSFVTKNFNADMISKVQVFDTKSKQAEFTGVNDGQKIKTLNLTLKEDSKKGSVLHGYLGADFQRYNDINGTLAAFDRNKQMAIVVKTANEGDLDMPGGLTLAGLTNTIADPLSASAGVGIPRSSIAGLHYCNGKSESDGRFTGGYQSNWLWINPSGGSTIRQSLPGTVYMQKQGANSINRQDQHGLHAECQFQFDSVNAVSLSITGSHAGGHNILNGSDSSCFNDTLINKGMRNLQSDTRNDNFQGNIMWVARSRKNNDRSFSLTGDINSMGNSAEGLLHLINYFYNQNGNSRHGDSADERKSIDTHEFIANIQANYVEPLWKETYIVLSYRSTIDNSRSIQNAYARRNDRYDVPIDSLGVFYQNMQLTHTFTVNMGGSYRNLSYNIGNDVLYSIQHQSDGLKPVFPHRQYINVNPSASIRWIVNANTKVSLDYRSSSLQPSFDQLEPVINNNDPLHIKLGNSGLRPARLHYFETHFRKVHSITMIDLGATMGLTPNAFSVNSYTDSLGRQLSQVVNVDGSWNIGFFGYIGTKIKKTGFNISLSPNWRFYRNINYVNNYLDHTDYYRTGCALSINKYVSDRYNLGTGFAAFYSSSSSSINRAQSIHYWSGQYSIRLSMFILRDFEMNTSASFNWQQKIEGFDKTPAICLWNAYIGRSFLKNQLSFRWQINDILATNRGFTRVISSNLITENTSNVIGRYWMLTASYRIMRHKKAD